MEFVCSPQRLRYQMNKATEYIGVCKIGVQCKVNENILFFVSKILEECDDHF